MHPEIIAQKEVALLALKLRCVCCCRWPGLTMLPQHPPGHGRPMDPQPVQGQGQHSAPSNVGPPTLSTSAASVSAPLHCPGTAESGGALQGPGAARACSSKREGADPEHAGAGGQGLQGRPGPGAEPEEQVDAYERLMVEIAGEGKGQHAQHAGPRGISCLRACNYPHAGPCCSVIRVLTGVIVMCTML